MEEPGIGGRNLGIGGQSINGRFLEIVEGNEMSTMKGSAGRGMVSRKALIGDG